MIRILIADDHIAIREGIKHILRPVPDMVVVGDAATLDEVVITLESEAIDLLLLDLSLGGNRGTEMMERIRQADEDVAVVVYTMYPEDQTAARLFSAGISGYVTKDSEPQLLIEAVRRVAEGGRFITPRMADELAQEALRRHRPAHHALSAREMEVLVMTAEGKSLKEIAARLGGVSLKTVSTYRARMLQKLGLSTNADAIRYALINRLRD